MPRRDYVRLTLSIDGAADAVGGSIRWLYRYGLLARRPTSTRLGRQGMLPASALGATLQARPVDRLTALPAVLNPEFVSGFPPKAARLCCISSTSLICNAPRDIVAHMSLRGGYVGHMRWRCPSTLKRMPLPRMSVESPPPSRAVPCCARQSSMGWDGRTSDRTLCPARAGTLPLVHCSAALLALIAANRSGPPCSHPLMSSLPDDVGLGSGWSIGPASWQHAATQVHHRTLCVASATRHPLRSATTVDVGRSGDWASPTPGRCLLDQTHAAVSPETGRDA